MDKKTVDTYNNFSKDYEGETADFWNRVGDRFVKKFIDITGEKILDVGSGPGRDALIFKKFGKKVICLDASVSMIKICADKGLEAIVGDFYSIPFSTGSFDGVWAYTSLLHIPKSEIREVLEEIKRVLVGGGILGLGMIDGEGKEYRKSLGGADRLFSYYKKYELEEILKNSGFEIKYFEEFTPGTRKYFNFIAFKK